jgi:hypothetical protein
LDGKVFQFSEFLDKDKRSQQLLVPDILDFNGPFMNQLNRPFLWGFLLEAIR